MVTLVCALVGVKGSAFAVDIRASKLVDHLKDAIKAKDGDEDIKCSARKLELFLAKKGDQWLPDDDPAAVVLEDGEVHHDIQTLINGEKMKATWLIEDALKANIMTKWHPPKSKEIHVLVVVPPTNKKQRLEWRSTRWGSHNYDPNSRYFLLEKEDMDESRLPPIRLMLYCRPTFHSQFEFLRERVLNEGHVGWILGPPGTGKSTTAMAFASTLNRSQWMVTWIHVEKDMDMECVFLAGEERMTRTIEIADVDEVLQIDDNKKHLLLVDGWTAADSFDKLTIKCNRWLKGDLVRRRLAFVCSVASRGKVQEGTEIRTRAMEFEVWSWTLDEYVDAKSRVFFWCGGYAGCSRRRLWTKVSCRNGGVEVLLCWRIISLHV